MTNCKLKHKLTITSSIPNYISKADAADLRVQNGESLCVPCLIYPHSPRAVMRIYHRRLENRLTVAIA